MSEIKKMAQPISSQAEFAIADVVIGPDGKIKKSRNGFLRIIDLRFDEDNPKRRVGDW